MQGTSKVRSGRATKKKRAPIETSTRETDESIGENEETVEAFGGDEAERAQRVEPEAPAPTGPVRSGSAVMIWFAIPLVLVLLYGLLTR